MRLYEQKAQKNYLGSTEFSVVSRGVAELFEVIYLNRIMLPECFQLQNIYPQNTQKNV